MTNQPPSSDIEAVDQLVRDHLDRLADRVDARSLVERVTSSQQVAASRGRHDRRWRGRLAWIVTAAAAVVVAFVSGRWMSPSAASAAMVLEDVHHAHSGPIDRCYHVHFSPNPDYWDGKNVLTGPSDTVLWTRGDRFWADATIGKVHVVFGRDARGELWLTPDPSQGVRLLGEQGSDELPSEIADYCVLNTMSVPALMEQVLADFDLRANAPPGHHVSDTTVREQGDHGHSIVWATLKPGRTHGWISAALLEVDTDGTLVRLVLWAVDGNRARGTSTFTLIQTGQIDDDEYQLSAHLDADAEVRDHRFKLENKANRSVDDAPDAGAAPINEDGEFP